MKVELLADKTTEQITELWKAYQVYRMKIFTSIFLEKNYEFWRFKVFFFTRELKQ